MVCLFNWTGVTSLEIASGPRRSRLFGQKVRIVTTLSNFTVRFRCEDGTEKLRVMRKPPRTCSWALVATGADAKRFSSYSRCPAFDVIGLLQYRLLVDSGY